MIDCSDVDSGFLDQYLEPENLDLLDRSMCPFHEWDSGFLSCPLEGWIIKTEGTKKTAYSCFSNGEGSFLSCDTFKRAMYQYKVNKLEFRNLIKALNAKLDYKLEP